MTDTDPPTDRSTSDDRNPYAMVGDDFLPPVEPPSARFILQLFVVPALIVLMVVAIWLVFTWLVHRTMMRPEDLIQGLESSTVARWQRASELADVLRDERYSGFRQDAAAAGKLSAILDREIDAAKSATGMDEEALTLRYFLCRTLGEFRVAEGTDVLLKAATTLRDPKEEIVCRGAIQAIAIRAFNLAQSKPPQPLNDPEVVSTLVRLSSSDHDLIRSETSFALGQIATPECLDRLEAMVDDPHADTRYNAAVALAHHGRSKAVETLAEMLDYTETASVRGEADPNARVGKRALIMQNAMQATQELARQNPDADVSPVIEALKNLIDAAESDEKIDSPVGSVRVHPLDLQEVRVDSQVVAEAKRALAAIQQH